MMMDLETWQRLAFDAMPVLLDAAVKGIVLLAAAGALVLAMGKASAAARQVVWLLALAALVALPLASGALPSWGVLPGWARIEMAAEPSPANVADSAIVEPRAGPLGWADRADMQVAPPAPSAYAAESEAPPAPTVALEPDPRARPAPAAAASTAKPAARQSRRMWIVPSAVATWLAGSLVCLLPLVLGRLSLWRLARRSRRIDGGSWAILLRRAAKAVGLRRGVQLLQSSAEPMPMVWGVLSPRLLIPAEAEDWSADRRWVVLLHELAHTRRHDCLAKLIAHVACALYWFNPLCWIAFKLMQRESEAACDDLVLSADHASTGLAGLRPSDYAQHLLEIASGLNSGMLAAYSSIAMARPSKLEGRLLAILDGCRNRRRLTIWGFLILTLLTASIVIPVSLMKAPDKAGIASRSDYWLASGATFQGVRPDRGDDLYDDEGNPTCIKVECEPEQASWAQDTMMRDFILQFPASEELITPTGPVMISQPGQNDMLAMAYPEVIAGPGGKQLVILQACLPREVSKGWLLGGNELLQSVDFTLRFFHGPRGKAEQTFAGPFVAGQKLQSGGITLEVKRRTQNVGLPCLEFAVSANRRLEFGTPLTVYDKSGKAHRAKYGGGGQSTDSSTFGFRLPNLPLEQIDRIAFNEGSYFIVCRNVRVAGAKLPARSHAPYLDRVAERLGLPAEKAAAISEKGFANPLDAVKCADLVRGRSIWEAWRAIDFGEPRLKLSALTDEQKDALANAAMKWATQSRKYRPVGVQLGLWCRRAEFIPRAIDLLKGDIDYSSRSDIARSIQAARDLLTDEQVDQLTRLVLAEEDPSVTTLRNVLMTLAARGTSPAAERAVRELAESDKPWLWRPAVGWLAPREKLGDRSALSRKMLLRAIAVTGARPGEEPLEAEARKMVGNELTPKFLAVDMSTFAEALRWYASRADKGDGTQCLLGLLRLLVNEWDAHKVEGLAGSNWWAVDRSVKYLNFWHGVDIGGLGSDVTQETYSNGTFNWKAIAEQALRWSETGIDPGSLPAGWKPGDGDIRVVWKNLDDPAMSVIALPPAQEQALGAHLALTLAKDMLNIRRTETDKLPGLETIAGVMQSHSTRKEFKLDSIPMQLPLGSYMGGSFDVDGNGVRHQTKLWVGSWELWVEQADAAEGCLADTELFAEWKAAYLADDGTRAALARVFSHHDPASTKRLQGVPDQSLQAPPNRKAELVAAADSVRTSAPAPATVPAKQPASSAGSRQTPNGAGTRPASTQPTVSAEKASTLAICVVANTTKQADRGAMISADEADKWKKQLADQGPKAPTEHQRYWWASLDESMMPPPQALIADYRGKPHILLCADWPQAVTPWRSAAFRSGILGAKPLAGPDGKYDVQVTLEKDGGQALSFIGKAYKGLAAACAIDGTVQRIETIVDPFNETLVIAGGMTKDQADALARRLLAGMPATNAMRGAIQNGKIQTVRDLLDANPTLADAACDWPPDGDKPILQAVAMGNADIVRLLLDYGASVNAARRFDGSTPLQISAAAGKDEVIRLLLDRGADIKATDKQGFTPLFKAVSCLQPSATKILLDAGADVNAVGKSGATPMEMIVIMGLPRPLASEPMTPEQREKLTAIATLLRHRGGKVSIIGASAMGDAEAVRAFIKSAPDAINKVAFGYITPLCAAAMYGHISVAELLLDAGASVNGPARSPASPLAMAAGCGHLDVVKLLVARGADVNFAGEGTALTAAAYQGHRKIVEFLLEKGAKPGDESEDGSALTAAARNGQVEIVKLLLDRPMKVNDRTKQGQTALIALASSTWPKPPAKGVMETAKLLIDRGADVNARDNQDQTALAHTINTPSGQAINMDLVKLLIDHGADVNVKAIGAQGTLLHRAAEKDDPDLAKLLIDAGADVIALNSSVMGQTPLELAEQSKASRAAVVIRKAAEPKVEAMRAKVIESIQPFLDAISKADAKASMGCVLPNEQVGRSNWESWINDQCKIMTKSPGRILVPGIIEIRGGFAVAAVTDAAARPNTQTVITLLECEDGTWRPVKHSSAEMNGMEEFLKSELRDAATFLSSMRLAVLYKAGKLTGPAPNSNMGGSPTDRVRTIAITVSDGMLTIEFKDADVALQWAVQVGLDKVLQWSYARSGLSWGRTLKLTRNDGLVLEARDGKVTITKGESKTVLQAVGDSVRMTSGDNAITAATLELDLNTMKASGTTQPAATAPAAPDAVGPALDAEAYIAASSDSKRLVVFHGNSARVLDALTGKEVSRFGEVEDMPAISPDGRIVATSRGKILDAATGRQVAQTDLGNVGTVSQPRFSNDGRSLAFFTNKAVVIYDTTTWKRKRTLPGPADELAGATMSGDGSTVAMTLGVPAETVKKPPEWWANSITVWDTGTGRKVRALSRTDYHPTLSNDGKLLAIGNEVVEVSTGKALWKWTGQRGEKWTSNATLAISPAGDIVAVHPFEEEDSPEAVAKNRRIELWNIRSGRFVGRLLGADPYLRSFWFSGDGQLLLGSYGTVREFTCVWRVSSATRPAGSGLEFRIVPNGIGSSRAPAMSPLVDKMKEQLGKEGPAAANRQLDEFQWFELAGEVNLPDAAIGEHEGRKYIPLSARAPFVLRSGEGKEAWGLAKVFATTDNMNRPAVGFELDDRGAELLAALTKANIGNALAIVVDGKVVSAQRLMAPLGKQGMITGRFSEQEVQALVKALEAGMLPARPLSATSRSSLPASAPIDPEVTWEAKVGQTITVQGNAFRQKSGVTVQPVPAWPGKQGVPQAQPGGAIPPF